MEYLQRGPPHLSAGLYVFQKQLNASQIIWYNKHNLVGKRSFYITTLQIKEQITGQGKAGQSYDTNDSIKP